MKIVKNNKRKENETLVQENKNLLSKKVKVQEDNVEILTKEKEMEEIKTEEVKSEVKMQKTQTNDEPKNMVTKVVNFEEVNDVFIDAARKNNFYAIKEAEEVYDKMNGYSPIELKDIENMNQYL